MFTLSLPARIQSAQNWPYIAPATQKYLSSAPSLKNLRERAPKADIISYTPVVSSHIATSVRQNTIHRSYIMVLHATSLILEFGRPMTMHVLNSVVPSAVFAWSKSPT